MRSGLCFKLVVAVGVHVLTLKTHLEYELARGMTSLALCT